MSVLAYLAKIFRQGRDIWYGPALVDEVGDPGSDDSVPTEAAVRSALATPGAHKDSHDPEDGSDPLDTAAPSTNLTGVTTNQAGSAHSFARSDHVHAITVTGADTNIVSGTAGGSGYLASWNGDGDLVDSTYHVNDSGESATDLLSASKIIERIENAIDGLDWQESVLDRYDPTSGTPGGPGTGDRYIATATANGWTDKYIYEWDGASWNETVPNEGYCCRVEDEDVDYVFNGTAWASKASGTNHNSLSGLQGGTTDEYYHLTSTQHTRLSPVTAFAASILDDADEATFKTTVNLEIGTDVQAYNAHLAAIAALSPSNGDILYYNSGWQRLAKGSDDQVLTLASGLPSWAAATGGSGDILSDLVNSEVAITGTTALNSGAYGKMHKCSGTTAAYNVTLPSPSAGKWIGFRFESGLTKIVTVVRNGAEKINGRQLDRPYTYGESALYFSDGTDWWCQEQLRQVSFAVTKDDAQTINYNAWRHVEFDDEVWDTHGCYDASSAYSFTPDAPGIYDVRVSVGIAGFIDQDAYWVSIEKNGTTHHCGNVGRIGVAGSCVLEANKNISMNGSSDYLKVYVWHDHSPSLALNTYSEYNRFSATRVTNLES